MLSARDTPALTVVEQWQEKHGKDEIILTVYRLPDGAYSYSVQCHLGRFVRSVFPQSVGGKYESSLAAQRAAVSTLRQWTRTNRAARERLRRFALISVGQREFDFGAD